MSSLNDRKQWFVVHTKARKEEYARWQLTRRGVMTFLPWIVRTSGVNFDEEPAPLFPGYLFVWMNLEEQYWSVVWAPGVRKLVGFGTPAPVDDAVMDFLRARAGNDCTVRVHEEFHAGERVRIKQGPLAGLIGIIEKPCSPRGRVRVLMELLRRQTSVEISEALLDRVAD